MPRAPPRSSRANLVAVTTGTILAEAALDAAELPASSPATPKSAAAPREPRTLTPALRRKLGLPARAFEPYRWPHAVIAVFVFGIPLALAGHPGLSVLLALVALVGLPLWHRAEHRVATAGEALFREGDEALARVLFVEPAGPGKRDHAIRVAYEVGGARVEARVVGAPLARQGLRPGEEIVVFHDRRELSRCLVVERATDATRERFGASAPLAHDDEHECCGGGKCDGKGGCGSGEACDGKGGCGGGGCGGGGCGGGGGGCGGGCGH